MPCRGRKRNFARPWAHRRWRRKGLFTIVEQLWTRPTLELNGIWGGYLGEGAKTVIPSKAYAKLSTRLVPNQDPAKIAKLVERHIRKLLPKSVTCKFEVLSTGKPWVAPYSHPIFQKAIHALESGFGKKAVFIREGGSIPFVTQMHDTFKVPACCWASDCRTKTRTRPTSTLRWKIISAASSPSRCFTSNSPRL